MSPTSHRDRLVHGVAPRLRATDLTYVASPEIKSSGSVQHIGTETTASFMVQADTTVRGYKLLRGMAAQGVRQHYVHYLCHISGLVSTKNTTAAERRGDGAPLHRDTAGTRPSSQSTAQSTPQVQLLLHLA